MESQVPATDVLPFRDEVRAMLDRVEAHPGPLVSLYLDVHAGTDPKAPAQRIDAALRDLPLEREDRERLEERILETEREVSEGWLVVFADTDPEGPYEHRMFHVMPPLPGGRQEYVSRYGEPLTAPLRLLMAEDPVVVTYVDSRRARIFAVDMGDVQETASSMVAINSDEWRDFQRKPTRANPTSGTGRSGSAKDAFDDRAEAWTARFTKALGERLADEVANRDGARLVLTGEPGRTEQVADALPAHLKDSYLEGGGAAADPDQPGTIWSRPLVERVQELLVAEEDALLEHLEQVGFSTLEETLDNLQKGLLERVAVPAEFDVEVLRCLENGWLAHHEDALREICGDGPVERVSLKEHLLKAVQQGAADLVLVRGPVGERIQDNFGGLAGIPRH